MWLTAVDPARVRRSRAYARIPQTPGDAHRVTLDEGLVATSEPDLDVVALVRALEA